MEQLEGAVRLFGASEALHKAMGVQLPRYFGDATDRQQELARARLGEEEYRAQWAKGRTMTLEQATALALALCDPTD
jgi:hypothetical protein